MTGSASAPGNGGMPPFCDTCGRPATDGDHPACQAARELEPPRFCPLCRRRMKVQVLPAGWRAECVAHGVTTSPAGAGAAG